MNELFWAYFDTSTLVKRYVRERGSIQARGLLRRYKFLSSSIAPVELLSALTRRHGQSEISEQDYSAILARIKRDRAFWELVELTPSVLTKAEEIVLKWNVRTLDAVHLASAVVFQDSIGRSLPFVTSDERQLMVARQCDLAVIPVGG